MTIYVDNMRLRRKVAGVRSNATWSHLFADTTTELLAFAVDQLGLRAEWLQYPGTHREHFDVTLTVRARAIQKGAVEITYPHEVGALLTARKDSRPFDLTAIRDPHPKG